MDAETTMLYLRQLLNGQAFLVGAVGRKFNAEFGKFRMAGSITTISVEDRKLNITAESFLDPLVYTNDKIGEPGKVSMEGLGNAFEFTIE